MMLRKSNDDGIYIPSFTVSRKKDGNLFFFESLFFETMLEKKIFDGSMEFVRFRREDKNDPGRLVKIKESKLYSLIDSIIEEKFMSTRIENYSYKKSLLNRKHTLNNFKRMVIYLGNELKFKGVSINYGKFLNSILSEF